MQPMRLIDWAFFVAEHDDLADHLDGERAVGLDPLGIWTMTLQQRVRY